MCGRQTMMCLLAIASIVSACSDDEPAMDAASGDSSVRTDATGQMDATGSLQDGALSSDSSAPDSMVSLDSSVSVDAKVASDSAVSADSMVSPDGSVVAVDYEACTSCQDNRCCLESGGTWTAPANSNVEQCVCPTGQAGVVCDEASDCLAGCGAPPKGPMPNQCTKVTKGTCNESSVRAGCYCRFDEEPGVSTHFCLG